MIEPLPPAVRGVLSDDPPRIAALLAVARRGGPATPLRPLAGSTFLARLAARAARAAATGPAGARLVAALARWHGVTVVEFGHWHGDWVPWNLGQHAGRLGTAVVTTGAGVAVPFVVLARLRRIPTVYIEVYDRIDA
ncbi:hypothetical protein SAMN04489832_7069 [Micromonospora cremea]|uniref:Uncharacterized protein n=1 Tax=Micromonospora cremea TaxID=709881 RepID=A0A1N6BBU9_9ACTN|nr:hypothetical protein SAMN04489832_7069 [Micromonospora cremea]